MKRISKITLYTLVALSVMACEKTVILDLDNVEDKIVIEGQVADRPGYQYVKVTRTSNFYSTGATPRVTDAIVTVKDDLGNIHTYSHNPGGKPDSAGYYLPDVPFIGEAGRTYMLTVVAEGETYTAQDKLIRIVDIDKLEYRIDDEEKDDPDPDYPNRYYEVLYYLDEPQDTKDYYLLKCYRNDTLALDDPNDVYYADDELIGESINGASLPVYYEPKDLARMEVFSLSREAYIYYRDLAKVLDNDGGMFNSPPADPRTNLSNGAYGFFQASAVTSKEITIEE